MKYYILLLSIFLSSCSVPQIAPAPVMAAGITPTATQIPTNTPVPSATIGYQETAVVAMQTANEASRVNAMITAEYEKRAQEQLQITAAAEYQYFVVLGWTATSAPTSVVLTATAQANYNTQVSGQQTLEAGRLTATAKAPTLIVAIADSENHAKHVEIAYILEWILKLSLAFFMVAIGAFMIWKMRTVTAADIVKQELTTEYHPPEIPEGLTPYVREDHGSGDYTKWFVPCNEEQMSEIWELVVNGERNFAINRLETTTRTLRRPVLTKLRRWLRQNDFATELGAGEIALNDKFVAFVEKWGEDRELEEGYQFAPSPTGENV